MISGEKYMKETTQLIIAMINYFQKDPKRINHFIKVHSYAKLICEMENIDSQTSQIIELVAIVHDIGIKNSEEKYGSSSGKYQQIEGPPEAEKMLNEIGVDHDIVNRICWLIAHHHTYDDIVDIDHQVLVEADFLVNGYEESMTASAINSIKNKIFKTESGKLLLKTMLS